MKFLTWQNPEQLFVAQDIIKVKIYSVAELRGMKKILIIIAVLLFLQARAQGYRSCEDKQLLVSKLSHICKYPIKLQASNQEAIVAIEYKTDNKGNIVKRKVVDCNNKKFKSATLEAFDKVKNIRINKLQQTDTIYFQYKIQGSLTPIHPLTDVEIIGYGSYDIPILMK